MGLFAVYYGAAVEGMDGVDMGFPLANADAAQTIEQAGDPRGPDVRPRAGWTRWWPARTS